MFSSRTVPKNEVRIATAIMEHIKNATRKTQARDTTPEMIIGIFGKLFCYLTFKKSNVSGFTNLNPQDLINQMRRYFQGVPLFGR